MKSKMIAAVMAAVMATSVFAGCSKTAETSSKSGGDQPAATQGEGETAAPAASAMVPGKLYFATPADGSQPVIHKVWITGNRAGTTEFNSKAPATEGLRCIFELNEYVDFYLESDAGYDLKVWVLKHRDDQSYYETAQFADQMPDFASYVILHSPEDDPADSWGSFYLNPDEHAAGLYDFVFTHEGKYVASMVTRFYNEGELEGKSDDELASMMKSLG